MGSISRLAVFECNPGTTDASGQPFQFFHNITSTTEITDKTAQEEADRLVKKKALFCHDVKFLQFTTTPQEREGFFRCLKGGKKISFRSTVSIIGMGEAESVTEKRFKLAGIRLAKIIRGDGGKIQACEKVEFVKTNEGERKEKPMAKPVREYTATFDCPVKNNMGATVDGYEQELKFSGPSKATREELEAAAKALKHCMKGRLMEVK